MRKEYIDMLECVGHGFWEWNPIANLISLSPQWITMLGYDVKEFEQTKDRWMSLIHPDDLTYCLNELTALLSGRTKHYQHQHRMLCQDGSYKWVLDQAKVIAYNPNGYPTKVVGTHTDIDELRTTLEMYKQQRIKP
ncbi:PAS domain-containing protein [Sulfurospirillum sp. UCH001]|jgi:PAS domain S-box-containing protein|uniref:PAS domain-containing protein n=1 Tax=Sulfurospirillum sp. UCH001 TaxID=1581011 RepID=UPI00082DF080|nr:PAS domain-containing protein [Sulfurospirillum sp. UCH001]